MKQHLKILLLILLAFLWVSYANGQSFTAINTTSQSINFISAANYRGTVTTALNTLSFDNLARNVNYELRVTPSGNFMNGTNSLAVSNLRLTATHGITNLSAASFFANNQSFPATGFLVLGNWTRTGGGSDYDPTINFTLSYTGSNALVPGNLSSERIYGPVTLSFALFRISSGTAFPVDVPRTMTVSIGIRNVIEVTLNTATTTLSINTPAHLRNGSSLALPAQLRVLSNQPYSLRAYTTAANLTSASTQTFAVSNLSVQVPTTGVGANTSFQQLSSSAAAPTILTTASPPAIDRIIDVSYRINSGPNILRPAGTYSGNLIFLATQ